MYPQSLKGLGAKRTKIHSELARHATVASEGEAAKTRTFQALAGMLYVPMTTLAVLFSSHITLTYTDMLARQYSQCQSSNFGTTREIFDTNTVVKKLNRRTSTVEQIILLIRLFTLLAVGEW
jgi:hypothetical protein